MTATMLKLSIALLLLLPVLPLIVSSTPPITPKTSIESYVHEVNPNITFETHFVETGDHYILQLHRLVGVSVPNKGKGVVFLQHGILASSWCWLANDPERSLAIQLWKEGYDVWLGNSRGNIFSRNHTSKSSHSKAFWDFTWVDMGRYDLPAQVMYVQNQTASAKISYIGWSQGNSQFFVANALSQQTGSQFLSKNIDIWIALSPVMYLKSSTSLLLSTLSKLHIGALVDAFFPYGFFTGSKTLSAIEDFFCKVTFGAVCKLGVDAICGVSSFDSSENIERLATHFPAGTSIKDIDLYEQYIDQSSRTFCDFDCKEKFELKAPLLPTAFFRGTHDDLVNEADFNIVEEQISNSSVTNGSTIVFSKAYEGLSHVSWMVGNDSAFSEWYPDILALLQEHKTD